MKKQIIFLLVMILFAGIYAQQVDRDMVVMEGAIGFW